MRLTTQTDYALRTLMFLAVQEDSKTIDDIAGAYDISRNHLMKVVQRLAAGNYINSQRGRGGGLTLQRAPEDINIGAVVREMESMEGFVECHQASGNSCLITPACELKHILADALEAFLGHMDKYTLADLVKQKPALHQIFADAV